MILQALYEYAQRKGDELPEDGFEDVEIKYLIKIREDGSLVDLVSTIEDKKGKKYYVPKPIVHTNAVEPSLLVDNLKYVVSDNKRREAFVQRIENLPSEIKCTNDIKAVIYFYRNNRNNGFDKLFDCELWQECQKNLKTTGYISFVILGADKIVPQIDVVTDYQKKLLEAKNSGDETDTNKSYGICLITGEKSAIARLHTPVPWPKSPKKYASLVSFQTDSGYDSYGKTQCFNAAVSLKAETRYTKALTWLLRSKENKFQLGEDTIVFWAEKQEAETFEGMFSNFFATDFDDPDRNVREVKNLFSAVQTGKFESMDSNFYVLCLSPNAARISVRFWETGKVETFAKRIKQHFDDFEIIRAPYEKEYLNLYQILSATALQQKLENVAPNLIGSVMHSILKALPYPATLQQQCIRRIRAEKDYKDDYGKWHFKVSRTRAAILKAYINRFNRTKNIKEDLIKLNRENKHVGYLLGRLFAVFEKVQQDTHPNLNATITDRFYGAASTNPVTVFTQLMRLNRNHMSSYSSDKGGIRRKMDDEIGEIMNAIDSFPAHLDLNEQSYFAIGYYHEKQSFFESNKSDKSEGEN